MDCTDDMVHATENIFEEQTLSPSNEVPEQPFLGRETELLQ